ncbi:MAG TPA: hypothetical protein VFG56_02370 [Candidatus Saccharimonadales bacterium]|nr:hypothetical protein [Candidatus Saccharimonadales bacterium]
MMWLKQSGSVWGIGYLMLCFFATVLLVPSASAYRATEYQIDQDWQVGSLVALDDEGQPILASLGNQNYIGVVVSNSDGSVQIADEASSIPMLVSRQTGDIKAGQRLGLSSVAGVAVKWQPGSPLIAVAKQSAEDWQTSQVVSDDGRSEEVSLSLVNVQLIKASGANQAGDSSYMNAIQSAANQIAGHSVAIWQISVALVLGLGGLILSLGLLFISSRESFFSIGRNPLAGNTIMGGLWKMSAVSVVIMLISLSSAYLILRIG